MCVCEKEKRQRERDRDRDRETKRDMNIVYSLSIPARMQATGRQGIVLLFLTSIPYIYVYPLLYNLYLEYTPAHRCFVLIAE